MHTKPCENFYIFNARAVSGKVFALGVRLIYLYLTFLKVANRPEEQQCFKQLPPLLKLELRTHFKLLVYRMKPF
uniref:Uncharacterized protein n=1 Tax=Plectus sambesii TaxID=2011161 RepID=A0A914VFI0_9BILA